MRAKSAPIKVTLNLFVCSLFKQREKRHKFWRLPNLERRIKLIESGSMGCSPSWINKGVSIKSFNRCFTSHPVFTPENSGTSSMVEGKGAPVGNGLRGVTSIWRGWHRAKWTLRRGDRQRRCCERVVAVETPCRTTGHKNSPYSPNETLVM